MNRPWWLPGFSTSTTAASAAEAGVGHPPGLLADLVRDAARHVPFYRRHWGLDRTVHPSTVAAQFLELPLLRKADLLAAEPASLLDDRFPSATLATEPTSGSSGQAFDMRIDPASHRRRRTRFLAALLSSGYQPGRRILVVSSQPTALINSRQRWMRRLGWHYVDLESQEAELAAAYARARPDVLYGPMSALLDLGSRLPPAPDRPRPRQVISTGEQLLPQHRRLLQTMFGSDVTDFYGMTELGLLAFRPPTDTGYRIVRDAFFMEFLPTPGIDGLERLVVTDLRGGALPLIRFDTGDLVLRDHDQPGRPITAFFGRSIDALVLADGSRLTPYRLIAALEGLPGLAEFRVLQQLDRSVDIALRCPAAALEATVHRARLAVEGLCPGLLVRVTGTADALPVLNGKLRAIRSLATAAP